MALRDTKGAPVAAEASLKTVARIVEAIAEA